MRRLSWPLLLSSAILACSSGDKKTETPPPAPPPEAPAPAPAPRPHVLLISIDGLRPDVLLRESGTVLRSLMARGSFTMWARTTAVSVTLPSHTSMVTGVPPTVHQIEWNHELPFARPVYPVVPTLFEIARKAGFTTALDVGKPKFSVLDKQIGRASCRERV
mgnify:CR=1 FL=1